MAGGCTAGAFLILLLIATPAFAQLEGSLTVGVGISTIRPSAPELSTRAKVRPSFGRVPSRGWGATLALNWFEADVAGDFIGVDGRLGTVTIRPLMLGVGYTWLAGRMGISPSVLAGPALNTLDIDDDLEGHVETVGSRFEANAGTVSVAVRSGVSVTYAVTPRVGLTAFGGYLYNRPSFTLRTSGGETQTRWSAGGAIFSAGLVVSFF